MTAEIISVGTELLLGQIADTHAQTLSRVLPEYGIALYHRQTVGDNLGRLNAAIQLALSRADIVFLIGGLGPTEDDLTREAIAKALGVPLELDPSYDNKLRKLFSVRNLPYTDSQSRQAMMPAGASMIENPNGSAPGLICPASGKFVIALPGPKGEFNPMVEGPVRTFFEAHSGSGVIVSRTLKVCAMGESVVEEAIRELLSSADPSIGIYSHPGEVHLRVTARGNDREEARTRIEPVELQIRDRLGAKLFGADDDTLESVLLEEVRKRGKTVVTAESCTGGWVGQRLTSVPGSSDVYLGGAVTYTNAMKEKLLGVPRKILDEFGAVSEEVARLMATGAIGNLGGDYAMAITGIAGPDGGSDAKPVGLVYIGTSGPNGTEVAEHRFRGTREFIRSRSVNAALSQLLLTVVSENS